MPLRSPDSFGTKPTHKLPWLSNQEYDAIEQRAKELGISLSTCPTCNTRLTSSADPVEGLPGPAAPTSGRYTYLGETYTCDCLHQDDLRRRYLLANIPAKYWRYGFEDWYGPKNAWLCLEDYLEFWPRYKEMGIGLEFYSPGQGSGKTFLATYIARELVKAGEKVYYTRMLTLMNLRENPNREAIELRLRNATALVLDEVGYGITEAQTNYYAHTLEDLVRDRVDYARPTIMTTNMTPDLLDQNYPRIYSVLAGAQMRTEVTFEDVRRKGDTLMLDRELIKRGETRPIR